MTCNNKFCWVYFCIIFVVVFIFLIGLILKIKSYYIIGLIGYCLIIVAVITLIVQKKTGGIVQKKEAENKFDIDMVQMDQ